MGDGIKGRYTGERRQSGNKSITEAITYPSPDEAHGSRSGVHFTKWMKVKRREFSKSQTVSSSRVPEEAGTKKPSAVFTVLSPTAYDAGRSRITIMKISPMVVPDNMGWCLVGMWSTISCTPLTHPLFFFYSILYYRWTKLLHLPHFFSPRSLFNTYLLYQSVHLQQHGAQRQLNKGDQLLQPTNDGPHGTHSPFCGELGVTQ